MHNTTLNPHQVQALRDALGDFSNQSLAIVVQGSPTDLFGMEAMSAASAEFDALNEAYTREHKPDDFAKVLEAMRVFREEVFPVLERALESDSIPDGRDESFVEAVRKTHKTLSDSEKVAIQMKKDGFSHEGRDSSVILLMTRLVKQAFGNSLHTAYKPFRPAEVEDVEFR
jgi:hypothetical protein